MLMAHFIVTSFKDLGTLAYIVYQYTKILFYVRVYISFFLNASYQFTPLLYLCPAVFGLTFFGWFTSIYLRLLFLREYNFLNLRPFFSGTQLGCKTKALLYRQYTLGMQCKTVKHSNNYCCKVKAAMLSVCTGEVHVTVNNMEILDVAQQCFYGDFLSPCQKKIASSDLHVKCRTVFSDYNQI